MTLLEQLQQLAPLAALATAGPLYVVHDSDEMISSYVLTPQPNGWKDADGNYNDLASFSDYDEAVYATATRNVLTPENLARWIARETAALATPAAALIDGTAYTLDDVRNYLNLRSGNPFLEAALRMLPLTAALTTPAAPAAGGAFGVKLLPATEGPGATLWGEHLYVLLPDGTITQAMWRDFFLNELEGEAWGCYTDVDEVNPLPVQPTHYFTPPAPRCPLEPPLSALAGPAAAPAALAGPGVGRGAAGGCCRFFSR